MKTKPNTKTTTTAITSPEAELLVSMHYHLAKTVDTQREEIIALRQDIANLYATFSPENWALMSEFVARAREISAMHSRKQ